MDAVLKVIGIVGAAWLLLSILISIAWAAGGRRIFRKPPVPTPVKPGDAPVVFLDGQRVTNYEVLTDRHSRERRNGGA